MSEVECIETDNMLNGSQLMSPRLMAEEAEADGLRLRMGWKLDELKLNGLGLNGLRMG